MPLRSKLRDVEAQRDAALAALDLECAAERRKVKATLELHNAQLLPMAQPAVAVAPAPPAVERKRIRSASVSPQRAPPPPPAAAAVEAKVRRSVCADCGKSVAEELVGSHCKACVAKRLLLLRK